MQLLNITTCCVTASALWVGIVRPLHNYALCLRRGALHRRFFGGRCLAVHLPGVGGIQDASLRRLLPTLSRIPYSLIGCASSLWLFFDGSAGIEEPNNPSKAGNEAAGRLTGRS